VSGSSTTFSWTTPDTFTTYAKLRIKAKNQIGNTTTYTSPFTFNIAPHLSEKALTAPWEMISIPLTPSNRYAENVIGDDITGFWRLYDYSPENGFVRADSLYTAYGNWLAFENNVTVSLSGAPTVDRAIHECHEGWNLAGDPFTVNVEINDLLFSDGNSTLSYVDAVNQSWILPTFYGLDTGSGSYETANELSPWSAYWFYVSEPNISMYYDPPFPGSNDPESESTLNEIDDWFVQIVFFDGFSSNNISGFGVKQDASSSYDLWYDLPAPPTSPLTGLDFHFEHSDWQTEITKFSHDIRQPLEVEDTFEWNFNYSSAGGEHMSLNFPDISTSLPDGYSATLYVNDESYNLLEENTIELGHYNSAGRIVVHSPSSGISNPELNAIPEEYSIVSAYPNPFNPSLKAVIALPESGELKLRLVNLLGQEVALITNSHFGVGYHSFTINGDGLSSGVYFINATVPGKMNSFKKIVFIQ